MLLMQSQRDGSEFSRMIVRHLALADLGGLADNGGVGSCAANEYLRRCQRRRSLALRHW